MEFEHVGNALCLELTNSIPDRASGDRDWLADPATAADWIGSLDLDLDRGADLAEQDLAEQDLAELRKFREHVFDVFDALASGGSVPQRSLDTITEAHARSLQKFGFRAPDGPSDTAGRIAPLVRDWPDTWSTKALIALFAQSAIDELTGTRLDRLKSCPSCHWLFIDTSRNRSRRWCSMQTCGGRDKALRHYRRTRP
ncbi:CGNR zinc finger domain-containing protein [Brevibacterium spongiae]|uniref:CGNR zinc finger domain-containing protein n=1 Tax=Brevibacterium spongiae TaxID=2909672 RepID=A0ABY5SQ36_9MICO|nr:CGNR zinc finger domain-containing protein [Brevibacterium spongiae]UVI36299.1 CGNR zinc finger domain-containing protein [Brevibacterium spongiae]